jgi:lysophospholipase L1-like esterase
LRKNVRTQFLRFKAKTLSRTLPWWKKLLIGLAGLVVFLLILEVGLRVFGLACTASRMGGAAFDYMSYGLFGGTTGETQRIMCVGDSFTFGGRVSEWESYPSILMKKLVGASSRKVVVINEGRCETNSREHLNRLQRIISIHRPNIIILLSGAANRFNPAGYADVPINPYMRSRNSFYLSDIKIAKIIFILWVVGKAQIFGSLRSEDEICKKYAAQGRFDEIVGACLADLDKAPYQFNLLHNMTKAYAYQSKYDAAQIYQKLVEHAESHPFLRQIETYTSFLEMYRDKKKFEEQQSQRLLDDLEGIVRICQSENIQLVIQNYPVDYPMANNALQKIAIEHALPFVDNLSAFRDLTPKSRYLYDDDHCTKDGHEVMVNGIIHVLNAEKML